MRGPGALPPADVSLPPNADTSVLLSASTEVMSTWPDGRGFTSWPVVQAAPSKCSQAVVSLKAQTLLGDAALTDSIIELDSGRSCWARARGLSLLAPCPAPVSRR
jgi:hypothetical protein